MNDKPQKLIRASLYGGASVLLLADIFFLGKAIVQNSFIPLLPIVAGIFITGGLLLIIYAESKDREEDKQEHRRLSRVAHQLENPLHILQEDLAHLVKDSATFPADQRLKLRRMETKTKVLLENIRDVFLMLQAQSGTLTQDVSSYDLCVVVDEILERVKPLATARNVEIVRKAKCDNAPVFIDRHLFMIAATHLIENAIMYTLTPGLVNVVIVRGPKHVKLRIQDRGIGVKAEDAHNIFLPYARGHAADQFDPDGIGVGLTLARLIITQIGGDLSWHPREKAGGTEFEIKLPLATL